MSACNILVVDDEPSMCRYLQTLLEADSYQVETASNGFQALERVQRSPLPDLVLLDLLMPDLDGLETLERLRQCRPALKVVMLSCVSEPCKVVQAMRLGAVDYLAKPFRKAELDAVLNHRTRPQSALEEPEAQACEVEELGENLSFVAAGPAMPQDSLAGRPDRQHRCASAVAGRERDGQRTGGQTDSQNVLSLPPHFFEDQLRSPAGGVTGKRAIWL